MMIRLYEKRDNNYELTHKNIHTWNCFVFGIKSRSFFLRSPTCSSAFCLPSDASSNAAFSCLWESFNLWMNRRSSSFDRSSKDRLPPSVPSDDIDNRNMICYLPVTTLFVWPDGEYTKYQVTSKSCKYITLLLFTSPLVTLSQVTSPYYTSLQRWVCQISISSQSLTFL